MAIIIFGATECPLCHAVLLEDQDVIAFPPTKVAPKDRSLRAALNDAGLHVACLLGSCNAIETVLEWQPFKDTLKSCHPEVLDAALHTLEAEEDITWLKRRFGSYASFDEFSGKSLEDANVVGIMGDTPIFLHPQTHTEPIPNPPLTLRQRLHPLKNADPASNCPQFRNIEGNVYNCVYLRNSYMPERRFVSRQDWVIYGPAEYGRKDSPMTAHIEGLHHVTAISGAPQENLDFYAKALGQRFVKKTVNFDDPGTYHLYYGDEAGTPGTIMTFFPWANVPKGRVGAGQVSITQYAVPKDSLAFWVARLPANGARLVAEETLFGEPRAVFEDPHGLILALVETQDTRTPWLADGITAAEAVRGFHGVTLALHEAGPTIAILTEVFEYEEVARTPMVGGEVIRLKARHGTHAGIVDIHADPSMPKGQDGVGTVHHVAFNVKNSAAQMEIQGRLQAAGQRVTPQIDRDYFWAIYTRTPGGILFEVATSEPGFDVDEPRESLGSGLKLPLQHEGKRAQIEAVLPPLEM